MDDFKKTRHHKGEREKVIYARKRAKICAENSSSAGSIYGTEHCKSKKHQHLGTRRLRDIDKLIAKLDTIVGVMTNNGILDAHTVTNAENTTVGGDETRCDKATITIPVNSGVDLIEGSTVPSDSDTLEESSKKIREGIVKYTHTKTAKKDVDIQVGHTYKKVKKADKEVVVVDMTSGKSYKTVRVGRNTSSENVKKMCHKTETRDAYNFVRSKYRNKVDDFAITSKHTSTPELPKLQKSDFSNMVVCSAFRPEKIDMAVQKYNPQIVKNTKTRADIDQYQGSVVQKLSSKTKYAETISGFPKILYPLENTFLEFNSSCENSSHSEGRDQTIEINAPTKKKVYTNKNNEDSLQSPNGVPQNEIDEYDTGNTYNSSISDTDPRPERCSQCEKLKTYQCPNKNSKKIKKVLQKETSDVLLKPKPVKIKTSNDLHSTSDDVNLTKKHTSFVKAHNFKKTQIKNLKTAVVENTDNTISSDSNYDLVVPQYFDSNMRQEKVCNHKKIGTHEDTIGKQLRLDMFENITQTSSVENSRKELPFEGIKILKPSRRSSIGKGKIHKQCQKQLSKCRLYEHQSQRNRKVSIHCCNATIAKQIDSNEKTFSSNRTIQKNLPLAL